jgi:hypothetical protein
MTTTTLMNRYLPLPEFVAAHDEILSLSARFPAKTSPARRCTPQRLAKPLAAGPISSPWPGNSNQALWESLTSSR